MTIWFSGAVVHGAMGQWRSGAVAQWRSGAVAQWRSSAVALPTDNREAARQRKMAPDASKEYPKKTNNRWSFVRYAELFIKIQITDMSYD